MLETRSCLCIVVARQWFTRVFGKKLGVPTRLTPASRLVKSGPTSFHAREIESFESTDRSQVEFFYIHIVLFRCSTFTRPVFCACCRFGLNDPFARCRPPRPRTSPRCFPFLASEHSRCSLTSKSTWTSRCSVETKTTGKSECT